MEITEVRVKLVEGGRDKLRAFCSITIDDAFVVRDLKMIDGTKGLFVAMPSRKLTTRCTRCGFKNQVRSNYCNDCGTTLPPDLGQRDGRSKMHADIAHPIHTECRELLQSVVVEAYLEEVEASQQPGYRPRDLDEEGGYTETRENEPERVSVLADRQREERPGRPPERESRGPVRGPVRDLDRDPRGFDRPAESSRRPAADSPTGSRERDARQSAPRAVESPNETPAPIFGSDERSPRSALAPRSTGSPSTGDSSTRGERPSPHASPGRESDRSERGAASAGRESARDPRSSGTRKRPLSEMPPPDDNFSAGIF